MDGWIMIAIRTEDGWIAITIRTEVLTSFKCFGQSSRAPQAKYQPTFC